jgi:hypothetical protein
LVHARLARLASMGRGFGTKELRIDTAIGPEGVKLCALGESWKNLGAGLALP